MRSVHLLPLLALSLSLGACGGTKNRGLESVHQPVVSRTHYVYDVNSAGGLSVEDGRQLAGWFESLKVGYGDRISIDDPARDSATRDGVAAIAARYGLLVDDTAPLTEGTLAPGSFRVVLSRARAEVPGCPDWSRKAMLEFNSNTMSNYGCSTNTNLAAMVADPIDLVHGREPSAGIDAQTAGKAIKTYRTAPSTGAGGLKNESTRSGN